MDDNNNLSMNAHFTSSKKKCFYFVSSFTTAYIF